MDAVPRRWFRRSPLARLAAFVSDPLAEYEEPSLWEQSGDLKMPMFGTGPEGEYAVVIECELAGPPSMVGRSVHVWIRGDEIEWLMKICREAAIDRRSEPMSHD